jgi:hypothetical protein
VSIKFCLVKEHVLIILRATVNLFSWIVGLPDFLAFASDNMPLKLLIRNNMILDERTSNLQVSEKVHLEK